MADFFSARELKMSFEWVDSSRIVEFPAISLTGFDFLFALAFLIGLLALNTLATIREEGEVGREIVMDELLAQSRGLQHAVSSVPGLRFVAQFPYSYLRHVPGVDVAIGVTAYQLAASTKSAVAASAHGTSAATPSRRFSFWTRGRCQLRPPRTRYCQAR